MLSVGINGRAIMFFRQRDIEGVTGAYGTAHQSVERFLGGQLEGAEPCRESRERGHVAMLAEGQYEKEKLGRV